MPYKSLGVIKNASKDMLLSVNKIDNKIKLQIYVTSIQNNLSVKLSNSGKTYFEEVANITPNDVYTQEIEVGAGFNENELLFVIYNAKGRELLRYEPSRNKINDIPEAAKPALPPGDIKSNEQLFLTGQHLEQYRHATYSPVPYYEKALEREPGDVRSNNALGLWYLRRGQFEKSEPYFRKAIETSIQRNPNPYDCEAYYNLGLCLKFQNKLEEAYKVFYKSTWNKAYKDSGYFSVAQIDMFNEDYELSLEHIKHSIDNNANNSKAYVLKSAAYRKLEQINDAIRTTDLALEKDAFNLGALFEKVCIYRSLKDVLNEDKYLKDLLKLSRGYEQNFIEYAIDYAESGLFSEAIDLLTLCD
ncbi:tetratricopeptide repeat protein [Pedobacter steynii]